MKKTEIDISTDNMSKHHTYQELTKKRDNSLKNENYVEAIAYSYAMIEDRLLSFLHHLYVIDRYKFKLEDLVSQHLAKKMRKNNDVESEYKPHIENISTKINIIKKLYNYKGIDSVLIKINNHIKDTLDVKQLQNDIGRLNKWLNYRNEITHDLFNKDLDDLNNKLKSIAEEGIYLSGQFDYYSDLLKGNINNKESLRKIFEKELEGKR